jgi:hypothetical protein
MAKEIDTTLVTKLAGIVKKEPGNSERFYSEKSGIPMGQILRYLVLAELQADPSLKIPATGNAIVKAREEGLRWPRIAGRAGISETEAKRLYEEKSGKSAGDSYSGRGRKTNGMTASAGTSGRRGATATKKSTAKTGTSGRRGGAKKTAAPVGRGRRGTRSSAKSGTADPK